MLKVVDNRSSKPINQDNFCKHEITTEINQDVQICILCGQTWKFVKRFKQWVECELSRESRKRNLKLYRDNSAKISQYWSEKMKGPNNV